MPYSNVPRIIGTLISHGKASLHELDTIYGIEDAYDMVEIIVVDSHNSYLLNKPED